MKEQTSAQPARQLNSSNNGQDVIVIDDDEEEDEQQVSQQTEYTNQYEVEQDEQDPDCPFPSIIQDVDIDLDADVLRLAVPSFSSFVVPDIPALAKTHMILAVACSNARVLLLTIPLAPPKPGTEQAFIDEEIEELELEGDSTIAYDLAVKVMPKDADQSSLARNRPKAGRGDTDGRLLVTAVATGLNLWSVNLNLDSISKSGRPLLPIMHSSSSGSIISFHSSSKSGQLLVANRSGNVRIYDAFATGTPDQTTLSREPAPTSYTRHKDVGRWILSYHSPFHASTDSPALARRKKILAASWVLASRGILVLLENGEWGVWDLTGSTQAGRSCEDFALRGFLGSSSAAEHVESGKHRKTASKLAPMTPNTRKAKAENLFSGTPKASGVAATGGISVALSSDRVGKVDENIIIWYNGDVYSIPSMQAFWQRSTNSGGGFGSLYAPGLTHISDINLMNENITSISQFASKATTTGLGQMNTQKDLLVSAEHRFVILQSLQALVPPKRLFQQELAERPASHDHRMLDAGELDLNGMDRVLDSMAGNGRVRRVGFAP